MPGVFISYRREDSQALAGRLFDRLAQRFGKDRVFRDIDAIEPGAKFTQVMAERIGTCDALVVLIGKGWLEAKDAQGRHRLDLSDDFVRAEIAEALTQRKLVIPVLIEGTPMPLRGALPPDIAALADSNALPVSDSRFDFDVGRLVSTLDKVVAPRIRDRLWRNGLVGLAVMACAGMWWQWNNVSKPPIGLPEAVPGKFNIAVAHLEGDKTRETEQLILKSLAKFPRGATLSFDRMVAKKEGDTENAEREGHERAQTLLKASGADVLIWGEVLKQGGNSVAKLYWTPARDVARSRTTGLYQMTEALSLPSIAWQDQTNILELLVATNDAEFAWTWEQHLTDALDSSVRSVRALLESSKAVQWSATTRAQVQTLLASALVILGVQSGQGQPLDDAVIVYRAALMEFAREKVPLDWAATQNNLGNALAAQGDKERDPKKLEQAVTAYRDALKEFTREKVPLDWAATQHNLGNALAAQGYYGRERHSKKFEQAVTAYRDALKEFTREKVPLDWAATQKNLGDALAAQGDKERDPKKLEQAVTAYRDALKEFRREKVPLDWAATQNNLGDALAAQGDKEQDPERLEEAASAYEEALNVFRAVKAKDWADSAEGSLRQVQWKISQLKKAK